MTIKEVFNQTKGMRPNEKARLVDMILLDLDRPDPSVDKVWLREVMHRKESIRSGRSKTLSYQQVMGKYK